MNWKLLIFAGYLTSCTAPEKTNPKLSCLDEAREQYIDCTNQLSRSEEIGCTKVLDAQIEACKKEGHDQRQQPF